MIKATLRKKLVGLRRLLSDTSLWVDASTSLRLSLGCSSRMRSRRVGFERNPFSFAALGLATGLLGMQTFAQATSHDRSGGGDEIFGREIKVLPNPYAKSSVKVISWSPDGKRIASLSQFDDKLMLWDVESKRMISRIMLASKLRDPTETVAFFNGGKGIVFHWTSYVSGHAIIASSLGAEPHGEVLGELGDIFAPPSNDNQYSMSLIDGESGEIIRDLAGPISQGVVPELHLVATAPTGSLVAGLFNSAKGQALSIFDGQSMALLATIFAPGTSLDIIMPTTWLSVVTVAIWQ